MTQQPTIITDSNWCRIAYEQARTDPERIAGAARQMPEVIEALHTWAPPFSGSLADNDARTLCVSCRVGGRKRPATEIALILSPPCQFQRW